MKKTIAVAVVTALAGAMSLASAQDAGYVFPTKAERLAGATGKLPGFSVKAGGDDCGTAVDIGGTLPFNDTGDTTGATSTVDEHPNISCTGWVESFGPDHIYSVVLGAANNVTVQVASGNWDVATFMLSTCGDLSTCVGGADANFGDDNTIPEVFNVTGVPAGTYFIYVDSYYAAPNALSSGNYNIAVTGTLPVELMEFSVD